MIFIKFFVHVAYRHGSVLLQRGNEISRQKGNFGVFFHTKTAKTDRDTILDKDSGGPKKPCIRRETDPPMDQLINYDCHVLVLCVCDVMFSYNVGTGHNQR